MSRDGFFDHSQQALSSAFSASPLIGIAKSDQAFIVMDADS